MREARLLSLSFPLAEHEKVEAAAELSMAASAQRGRFHILASPENSQKQGVSSPHETNRGK